MKAAMYYNNKDIRIIDIPRPQIKEGEILVKVKSSGICGTDVMEWYRIKKAPRILGHEITGEVAESKSIKFKAGDRVFVSHHVPCNICKYCLEGNHTACETLHGGNYEPGGFAEFIRVPKINVENGTYILGNLTYEEGTLIEPLACCVRGQRVINLKAGHTVLILGAGISGIMNIMLAKLKGAEPIATDIDDWRLEIAKKLGAKTVNVSRETLTAKADRAVMCTGAMSAVKQAFESIDKKGIILFFAIPQNNIELPIADFWRNEWTITSSYGASPADLEESIKILTENKINAKSLITHKVTLDEIQKGFNLVAEAKKSLKVVINF